MWQLFDAYYVTIILNTETSAKGNRKWSIGVDQLGYFRVRVNSSGLVCYVMFDAILLFDLANKFSFDSESPVFPISHYQF